VRRCGLDSCDLGQNPEVECYEYGNEPSVFLTRGISALF
jgi:hypothetical protein